MNLDNQFDWKSMIDVDAPEFPEITEKTKNLRSYGHGDARRAVNALKILRQEEQKLNLFRKIANYFNDFKQEIQRAFEKYNESRIWNEY